MPPLTDQLLHCAGVCEETLAAYLTKPDAAATRAFSPVMLAMAAIEQAAESTPDDPMHEPTLMLTATLCRDACEQIRSHGLDRQLLRCAEACDRAMHLCETALNPRPLL